MKIQHYRGEAERKLTQYAIGIQQEEQFDWTEGLAMFLNNKLAIQLSNSYAYGVAADAITEVSRTSN